MVKLATDSIIDSILKITDTNELREISNALHQHRTYMNAQATRNFVVGDKVEFEGRRGRTVQGIVKSCLLYTSPSPRDRG